MRVTFTRTGERRYKVSVEGKGLVPSELDPAPGYDPLLPHDMAHFVVENSLGLMGVFGQLAEGGNAHTFRRTVGELNGAIEFLRKVAGTRSFRSELSSVLSELG